MCQLQGKKVMNKLHFAVLKFINGDFSPRRDYVAEFFSGRTLLQGVSVLGAYARCSVRMRLLTQLL